LKNQKKLKSFLQKNRIEAYRIYSKDIPEYPYMIDIYGTHAVIYEQGKKISSEDSFKRESHQNDIMIALEEGFGIKKEFQHFKIREKQKGNNQYRPIEPGSDDFFPIDEPPFRFLINLERYLDTGLFLDHRPLRQHLLKNSMGKKVLNLFSYTGSLSVAAALGGGIVTSIDMSKTYLDWAYENFILNNLDPKNHIFYQADVLREIKKRKEEKESFDLIILDPPSFSNSKRMEEDLDIERDHPILVRDAMSLLAPKGILYFSTNKRKFELHPIISETYKVKEISQWTIPQDFHSTQIHRAFSIEKNLTI
jgi:23S rRNA (cytosine1962-C5)-methyltransferase/23S rRNA (guanine2445-N2)-methyltransferase / 23S rRNA (guanine2069-N7)-methyltransferase